MTQILDVIGMIVAVAAIGVLVVGTDGAFAAALPALIGWVSVALGGAQVANSVVSFDHGHGSREQEVLGIGVGVLSMVSGGLIGQAARDVNGTADAGSALERFGGDIVNPPTVIVPTGATFTTSFASRLTTLYTPVLSVTNLVSSGQSVGTDFVDPNFSILDPVATQ